MVNIQSTLEKYSKNPPISPTLAIKKEIISALSPHFSEDQIITKVKKTNWANRESIRTLCAEKLSTILILDQNKPAQEKHEELALKAHESIERQKIIQQTAIDEKKIQRIPAISYHTLIDTLAKRTSKAEYKFQTSWTPLFEDTDAIEHYAIEPYGTKRGEAKDQASYKPIVTYSVYDITHMPAELIDLALHGTMKSNYPYMQELDILIEGTDKEDIIKEFLLDAKPLQYANTKGGETSYTQRILSLFYHGKKVGYLLSENTPISYEDKKLSTYTNNIVRYQVFAHKKNLINHLNYELPYVIEKTLMRKPMLITLEHFQRLTLKEIYKDTEWLAFFNETISSMKEEIKGLTLVEQKIRKALDRLHMKNASADQLVLNSMIKRLREGKEHQDEKLATMNKHIESLILDPEF